MNTLPPSIVSTSSETQSWNTHLNHRALPVYQARKFKRTADYMSEVITLQPTAQLARDVARLLRPHWRNDWEDIATMTMDAVLEVKFMQHEELCQLLLSTGRSVLIQMESVSFLVCDHIASVSLPILLRAKAADGHRECFFRGRALMRLRERFRDLDHKMHHRQETRVVPGSIVRSHTFPRSRDEVSRLYSMGECTTWTSE